MNSNKKLVDKFMTKEIYIDSIQQSTSIERDKNNEIFDRLLKFGIESVRLIISD